MLSALYGPMWWVVKYQEGGHSVTWSFLYVDMERFLYVNGEDKLERKEVSYASIWI